MVSLRFRRTVMKTTHTQVCIRIATVLIAVAFTAGVGARAWLCARRGRGGRHVSAYRARRIAGAAHRGRRAQRGGGATRMSLGPLLVDQARFRAGLSPGFRSRRAFERNAAPSPDHRAHSFIVDYGRGSAGRWAQGAGLTVIRRRLLSEYVVIWPTGLLPR